MCERSDDCVFKDEFGDILGMGGCQDEVCLCPVFFGYSGVNCTESSEQLVASRILEWIAISSFSLVILVSIFFLYRSVLLYKRVGDNGSLKKTLKGVFWVIFCVLLGGLSNLCQSTLVLRTLYDPSKVEENLSGKEVYIWVEHSRFYELIRVFAITALLLSVVLICISWIDLLEQLSEVCSAVDHIEAILRVKKYLQRAILASVLLLFTVAVIPDTSLKFAFLLSGFLVLFVFILLVTARIFLIRLLKKLSKDNTRKAVSMISKISLNLCITVVIAVTQIIVQVQQSSRTKLSDNEDFDYVVFLSKCVIYGIFINVEVVLIVYSYRVMKNIRYQVRGKSTQLGASSPSTEFNTSYLK